MCIVIYSVSSLRQMLKGSFLQKSFNQFISMNVFKIIQSLNVKYFMQTFPVTRAKTTIYLIDPLVLENIIHVPNFIRS
jgi:hypothetical protein